MTDQRCPTCASEEVYSLMNTLHCKRCGNIWKEGDCPAFFSDGCRPAINPSLVRKKTEKIETRMEARLDEYLARSRGKFCFDTLSWKIGDISLAIFRRYLKHCVKNGTLVESRDGYGRTWYSRP
jgi:hypothetical protein